MLKSQWAQRLPELFLCSLAFSIPFPFIYGAISLVLLLITWLLTANLKVAFTNLKGRKIFWVWIAYFLLHAASYFYSDNKDQSLFDLQTKLSILILPVVVGAGMQIKKQLLERIALCFVIGLTVVALMCLIKAILVWQSTGNTEIFFYHKLIGNLEANAVYEAWYTFFSITLLLFFPWKQFLNANWRFLRMALFVLHLVFFLLLSARMLIALFFLLMIPYYALIFFRKRRISFLQKGAILSLVILLAVVLIKTENPIKHRYAEVMGKDLQSAFFTEYHDISETEFSNFSLRVFLWRLGFDNVKEHNLWWFGAGNGDAQKLQNDKIAAHHIIGWDPAQPPAMMNANLHNMPMQSLVMIGLPGAILFLIIALAPLFNIRGVIAPGVFLIFHISAIAFMMQEAALQTQAGVLYYSFFSSIFWSIRYQRREATPLIT